MTTKFLAEGEVFNHVASGAKTAGQVVLIGDRIGIALAAIADGATGALAVEGVFTIDKTTPEAYAQGDQLYWVVGMFKVLLIQRRITNNGKDVLILSLMKLRPVPSSLIKIGVQSLMNLSKNYIAKM